MIIKTFIVQATGCAFDVKVYTFALVGMLRGGSPPGSVPVILQAVFAVGTVSAVLA